MYIFDCCYQRWERLIIFLYLLFTWTGKCKVKQKTIIIQCNTKYIHRETMYKIVIPLIEILFLLLN